MNRLISMDPDLGDVPTQIFARIGEDGVTTFEELPGVLQLDYITRALNDVAKRGDGAGALGGNTNEGRIFGGLARRIRSTVKELVPSYKRAVDRAATEIGEKEARDLGEVALRAGTRRSDLQEAISDMGSAELGKLRAGVRSHIDETLANVRRTITDGNVDAREAITALKALSSRASQEKVEMILGEGPARTLMGRMKQAERAFELRSAAATNSKTFARQSVNQQIKAMTEPGAIGVLMEGAPAGAARRLIQRMTAMTPEARAKVEEKLAGEIATILTQKRGPSAQRDVEAFTKLLERQPVTEALAARVGAAVATGTASGGYSTGRELTK